MGLAFPEQGGELPKYPSQRGDASRAMFSTHVAAILARCSK
jgi:hypothetical protein